MASCEIASARENQLVSDMSINTAAVQRPALGQWKDVIHYCVTMEARLKILQCEELIILDAINDWKMEITGEGDFQRHLYISNRNYANLMFLKI
ncbi:hypothetical protein TNCV_3386561 [Trichonephila clavipes]|nr:hypothetical protein TNCV_3386561 [Trichonephila clavipes]